MQTSRKKKLKLDKAKDRLKTLATEELSQVMGGYVPVTTKPGSL